ncbi:MAG: hypothetical protein BZY88_10610 [SAR202 cluster bacterium Io17-Chloro-G9]|nr:MAG: hypothetical protein BZY88_10610 [SAR202 cluster bacterium Io17-Chloro-G9]
MAQQTTPPSESDVPEPDACRHHWSIQPATGPVSQGVCHLCGEVREFKNYVEAATWGDSRLSKRANSEESKGMVKPVANAADNGDEDEDEEE